MASVAHADEYGAGPRPPYATGAYIGLGLGSPDCSFGHRGRAGRDHHSRRQPRRRRAPRRRRWLPRALPRRAVRAAPGLRRRLPGSRLSARRLSTGRLYYGGGYQTGYGCRRLSRAPALQLSGRSNRWFSNCGRSGGVANPPVNHQACDLAVRWSRPCPCKLSKGRHVAVLMGGLSSEREISLSTGRRLRGGAGAARRPRVGRRCGARSRARS